jgi:DNA polymerase-3 subunit beta
VATDGRRLATSEKKMSVSVENPTQFILPAKTISELQKQLGSSGKIRFALSERQVVFEIDVNDGNGGLMDKIRIVSKIVEGNYPQYKGVIPKDSGNRIEVEREDLLSAVLQAAKVTTDKNSSVVLNISANLIEITASSTEYGEASDKLAVRYEGPEARIAFNPQFITDPLKALTQDSVVFEFKDDLSPGVFKTKDESFLCVVMPQRK